MFICVVIISLWRKFNWLVLRIGRAWEISEENVSLIENHEQTHLVDSLPDRKSVAVAKRRPIESHREFNTLLRGRKKGKISNLSESPVACSLNKYYCGFCWKHRSADRLKVAKQFTRVLLRSCPFKINATDVHIS